MLLTRLVAIISFLFAVSPAAADGFLDSRAALPIHRNHQQHVLYPSSNRHIKEMVLTLRSGAKSDGDKLGLGEHVVLAIRELAESAAYGSVYALFALLFAGWVEGIFPRYSVDHKYTIPGLLFQVVAQAGMNASMAQFTRRIVSRLKFLQRIDGRTDKTLPAAGGGVVFAFLMFTRESNWKAKVVALDALLDRTSLFQ